MSAAPKSAMVLAAGLGTRLRPVTDHLPKPLVEVAGQTLLDHAIDRLAAAGVERVVVGQSALQGRELIAVPGSPCRGDLRIELSREEALVLETGGGVKHALPLLGDSFFVVNGDILWLDGITIALSRLAYRRLRTQED